MQLFLRKKLPEPADKGNLRDLLQESLRELRDLDMILSLLLSQDDRPQGIHHPGNIDPLGTPRRALETGGAEPKGIGLKHLLFQTQERIANNLMRTHLHGKGDWTSGGTIPALVTREEVLTADQFDFLRKVVVDLLSSQLNFHSGLQGLKESFKKRCYK